MSLQTFCWNLHSSGWYEKLWPWKSQCDLIRWDLHHEICALGREERSPNVMAPTRHTQYQGQARKSSLDCAPDQVFWNQLGMYIISSMSENLPATRKKAYRVGHTWSNFCSSVTLSSVGIIWILSYLGTTFPKKRKESKWMLLPTFTIQFSSKPLGNKRVGVTHIL